MARRGKKRGALTWIGAVVGLGLVAAAVGVVVAIRSALQPPTVPEQLVDAAGAGAVDLLGRFVEGAEEAIDAQTSATTGAWNWVGSWFSSEPAEPAAVDQAV